MTHRVRLPLACALVLLAACGGESEQEKANRAELGALVQRYQGLARDYAEWAEQENDDAPAFTWADAFEEYDRFIDDQQELRADLRGVVTTPKFACVSELLGRAIENDVAFLRARKALLEKQFAAKSAAELYERNMASMRASYYGQDAYIRAAGEALEAQLKAFEQAERFTAAANERTGRLLPLSDSLAFAARQLELLPMVDTARTLPYVTEAQRDTMLTSDGVGKITAVCAPPAPPRRDKHPPTRNAPAADSLGTRAV